MKLLAYHKFLLSKIKYVSEENKDKALASLIYNDIQLDQNLAFDLLAETGDKKFTTPDTFLKAAKILIEAEKNEK